MSTTRERVTYFITRNRDDNGELSDEILIWTRLPKRHVGEPPRQWVFWGFGIADGKWCWAHFAGRGPIEWAWREYGTVPDNDMQVLRVVRSKFTEDNE